MAAVAREFRLLNGELVEHEGLAEAESIVEAQQLVAEALKLKAQQIVFFGVSGVLGAGDPLEGDIQVYIQEVKITKEEFLAKACVKLEDAGTMKSLKMTRLCALPADVGDFLPQLTWLTLTNNYLSHCPNSLGQLKNLAKLYLEGNQLSELPESIGDLAALQVLQLDRNQFQNLPSVMFRLANLQELSAKSNQIAELPPEIANLRGNLTQLNLAKNRLSSVPPSIGQLEHLIELVLAENQLLTVPDVLNLQKLKLLDMSFNKLQSLPKSITQAQVLEELLVNNNRISSLPEEIGRLQALRDFNLNANVLVSLPESFGLLENLQNVWLDKGQMMVLPVSSRKLLRVAATLYTSLEDDDLAPTAAPAPTAAAVAPAAAARPAKSPKASKVERVKAIFDQFDLNQDGFIDKEELRTVLQKIRDIGSAISDEMIDMALDQMDTNKDSLINFDEFLAWLYSTRPSTEKHLLRRAVGILEEGESPTSSPASRAAPERREAAPPALTRVSSRALAEQAQRALEALNEEDLVAVLVTK